jgi:hypothetical protein
MWSLFFSTYRPVTCCMLHRFGKGLGQNGSTRKTGVPCASTACFCCACERPTEIAVSAKRQQTRGVKDDAVLRSFFVFTGCSSSSREATRTFEGPAKAKVDPPAELLPSRDKLFAVRRYPITLLTLHVVPFFKSASLSSGKRRKRQETGKGTIWIHPGVSPLLVEFDFDTARTVETLVVKRTLSRFPDRISDRFPKDVPNGESYEVTKLYYEGARHLRRTLVGIKRSSFQLR